MRPTGRPTNCGRRGYPVASGSQRFSIISDGLPSQLPDIDPDETREWIESFDTVVRHPWAGARQVPDAPPARAGPRAGRSGCPALRSTDYINTIPPEREPWFPGDEHVERRIRAYIRWNAADHGLPGQPAGPGRRRSHRDLRVGGVAVRGRLQPLLPRQGPRRVRRPGVLPGSRRPGDLRPRVPRGPADRGRSSTGSGRSCRSRRRAAVLPAPAADAGLLGVPHGVDGPRPADTRSTRPGSTATCSPARSHDTSRSHVWAFLGDGEMDEPEALGAIGLAAREELDNLTFVINCNLQRLDGPVRGNGEDHPGARGRTSAAPAGT